MRRRAEGRVSTGFFDCNRRNVLTWICTYRIFYVTRSFMGSGFMAKKPKQFPAELELRILKVLWREGALRVRDVRKSLAEEGRDLAHTTIVTTLNTMVDKRFVKRTQQGNAYIFDARVTEEDVSQGMLSEFVNRVFDGSAVSLLLNLLDSEQIDADEYSELRRLIRQKAKEKK